MTKQRAVKFKKTAIRHPYKVALSVLAITTCTVAIIGFNSGINSIDDPNAHSSVEGSTLGANLDNNVLVEVFEIKPTQDTVEVLSGGEVSWLNKGDDQITITVMSQTYQFEGSRTLVAGPGKEVKTTFLDPGQYIYTIESTIIDSTQQYLINVVD